MKMQQIPSASALRESLNEYDAGWVGFLEERRRTKEVCDVEG